MGLLNMFIWRESYPCKVPLRLIKTSKINNIAIGNSLWSLFASPRHMMRVQWNRITIETRLQNVKKLFFVTSVYLFLYSSTQRKIPVGSRRWISNYQRPVHDRLREQKFNRVFEFERYYHHSGNYIKVLIWYFVSHKTCRILLVFFSQKISIIKSSR